MPHIPTPANTVGIGSLLAFRPETAQPLMMLAQTLLRGETSPLTPGERELIAAYTSSLNACSFCTQSHAAAAAHLPGNTALLVQQVLDNPEAAPISELMKALLALAARVQLSGGQVRIEDIDRARAAGAGDIEIHDTVLIAAAFCMFNRYVDGLGAITPVGEALYDRMGAYLAENGYGRR
ncbi:MAG: peroxidase-related enzyme [Candidatus Kapaibacterium sp.]